MKGASHPCVAWNVAAGVAAEKERTSGGEA